MDTYPPARPRWRWLRELLRSHAVLRFLGDAANSGFLFLTAIVTARALGPSGKGALSTLSYLVALAWPLSAIGTGEASIAMIGRGVASFERTIANAITMLVLGTVVMAPIVLLVSGIPALGVANIEKGRLAAAVAVGPMAFAYVLPLFADLRRRFSLTSGARVLSAAVTFVVTVVLVQGRSQAVFGAMVAVAAGPIVATLAVGLGLHRQGVRLRPRLDATHARTALRLALPVQAGLLLVIGAARLDLLVVAAVRSTRDVGTYSVALTVAQIVTLAPVAVSVAAFPRIAEAESAMGRRLATRAFRTGLITGAATAAGLAAVVPTLLPAVFGIGFRPSVGPTLALLPSGVAVGLQWIAGRVATAIGDRTAFAATFGTSVVFMLIGDVLLIPSHGLAGAAIAATIGSVAGLGVAMARLRAALEHSDRAEPSPSAAASG